MGPSGCGKTSFLDILGARNSPTRGGLAANGRLYDGQTRKFIGLVPQVGGLLINWRGWGLVCSRPCQTPQPRPDAKQSKAAQINKINYQLSINRIQDEALFPTLTVQESLNFSAELRLPPAMPKRERCVGVHICG